MVHDRVLRSTSQAGESIDQIGAGTSAGTNAGTTLSAESTNFPSHISTKHIEALITSIVGRELESQGRDLVHSIINPNPEPLIVNDQTIDAEHRENLGELDKIPDVVKCLRDFSGKAGEFSSWEKSVNRVLQIYESCKGTPKYFGILNVIRNKIVGNADITLESYNTPLDWRAISRCLTLHYADKRDLGTLEYQMSSLIQGSSSVEEFYQEVYSHLSLILNKLSCMEAGHEALNLLTQTYRDKALDTFIRGLRGDLSRLLGIKEPADLPQALHLCLKLQNQSFRTNYANNASNTSTRPIQHYPSQRPNYQYPRNRAPCQPQPLQSPVSFHNNTQRPNFSPNNVNHRPSISNQQRSQYPAIKPEPENPNPSFRTNVTNKSQFKSFGKRPSDIHNSGNLQKFQRNYHISTNRFSRERQGIAEEANDNINEGLTQYSSDNNNVEIADYSDIHFLDNRPHRSRISSVAQPAMRY